MTDSRWVQQQSTLVVRTMYYLKTSVRNLTY